MATESQRFSYNTGGHSQDGSLPYLPEGLRYGQTLVEANALLDSGASANVLPYGLGLQLGFVWDQQGQELALGGNLSSAPVKGYG